MKEVALFFESPTFKRILLASPENEAIYLVGGAIRDALLNQPVHDLDFTVPGDPRPLVRKLANQLGGAYFLIDDERQTARIILKSDDGAIETLDFARFRGDTLEEDLKGRDFTINSIALHIQQTDQLIDPLGGINDLHHKRLRACSPTALEDDPIRIIRGIRLALTFGLQILPDTIQKMKLAAPQLDRVSYERRRDELFRILEGNNPAAAVRSLDLIGALQNLLPELSNLKGVTQSPPHISDVWEHTLATARWVEEIIQVLSPRNAEKSENLSLGMLVMEFGRFRQAIHDQLASPISSGRKTQGLLVLAALYHDIAKPQTWRKDEEGRIRNFGHEEEGADTLTRVGKRLQLSNDEVKYLQTIVRNHMRIHLLSQTGKSPSRRAIYRYFRDTGPAGIEICLLTLADTLATYGSTLDISVWQNHLDICRILLECWLEKPTESVNPPVLVNGYDLQEEFQLSPGPLIGTLLEALREAQAEGEIHNHQQALEFARAWITNHRGE